MTANPTIVDRDHEPEARGQSSGDAPSFEIDHQSGHTISNVGGDQTNYYGDRGRASRVGKIIGALGLLLSLIGSALLVRVGVITVQRALHHPSAGRFHAPLHYVPGAWPAVLVLLVSGYVVRHFARIVAAR
jgi:hypothetical protein